MANCFSMPVKAIDLCDLSMFVLLLFPLLNSVYAVFTKEANIYRNTSQFLPSGHCAESLRGFISADSSFSGAILYLKEFMGLFVS